MTSSASDSRALFDIGDAEQAAFRALPRHVWDFIDGGSGSESTLVANRTALDRIGLTPRVLTGVTRGDSTGELLGSPVSMPLAVAPMAYQQLVHPDGELALARAARSAGVVFIASMLSSHTVEAIAGVGAETWFQLYWLRDRDRTEELIKRAEASGCRALVLTVDVPRMGRRLRDMRNAFTLPSTVTAANLDASPAAGRGSTAHSEQPGSSAVMVHTAEALDPALSWADLEWVRDRTGLPLVLKGVMDPADAARAVDAGVDAMVVSNHGGRQLDGALPSITALSTVVREVSGRCPVLVDSGIRSGTDVLRALALGASGALVGRPALWGLAAGGQDGASRVLRLLHTELEHAMTLAGCADLSSARRLTTTAPADVLAAHGGTTS
ncbi:alpha-hydroxy acid oxidase [Streptomyces sp. NPDC088358]|uniref:alpha-hydroxy acid oxidase n=1 Tax=Streptomyces sp. NPDC088358 TaxID=3365857 RepID=UPI0038253C91